MIIVFIDWIKLYCRVQTMCTKRKKRFWYRTQENVADTSPDKLSQPKNIRQNINEIPDTIHGISCHPIK